MSTFESLRCTRAPFEWSSGACAAPERCCRRRGRFTHTHAHTQTRSQWLRARNLLAKSSSSLPVRENPLRSQVARGQMSSRSAPIRRCGGGGGDSSPEQAPSPTNGSVAHTTGGSVARRRKARRACVCVCVCGNSFVAFSQVSSNIVILRRLRRRRRLEPAARRPLADKLGACSDPLATRTRHPRTAYERASERARTTPTKVHLT